MRLRQTWVLIRREYLSRIRSKAFWISTLVLPLFMIAIFGMSILAQLAPSSQTLAVVDASGKVGPLLVEDLTGRSAIPDDPAEEAGEDVADEIRRQVTFDIRLVQPTGDPEALRAELRRQVLSEEIDAWLWISEDTLRLAEEGGEGTAHGNEPGLIGMAEYHGVNTSNVITRQALSRSLSSVVRNLRFTEAGIEMELVRELSAPVRIASFEVTEAGSTEKEGELQFLFAYGLGFLLYMVLVIYGNQVMSGVLEEKTSRVVEVLMATVSPFELMMGKLAGICLAVLTQLGVWFGTLLIITAPSVVTAIVGMEAAQAGSLPNISAGLILHFMALFLLGYFVYATFYAAIGAAFNSVQEAQQFSTVAVAFIIAPLLLMIPVINDPDSTLSVVTSLFPPFTPILMMLRIAVKMPPFWQVALAYVLTTTFGVFMIWLAGRIYRVGILMVGKKPTIQEMWRWMRYG